MARTINEEQINKNSPWAFFGGAPQNQVCRGAGVLYLSESHYYHIEMNLRSGMKNSDELYVLKLILCFSLDKNCENIHIFRDSMLVMNWINKVQIYHNIFLHSLF